MARMMQVLCTRRPFIVVVDDDEAVRDSLEFSLQIEGFAVRSYSGAQEFLADDGMPACDCLIVDQNMPGMSGLDLISALRVRKVATPVILITSHVNAALRERAAAAGVLIVEKPFFGSSLLDGIRQSVARQEEPLIR